MKSSEKRELADIIRWQAMQFAELCPDEAVGLVATFAALYASKCTGEELKRTAARVKSKVDEIKASREHHG